MYDTFVLFPQLFSVVVMAKGCYVTLLRVDKLLVVNPKVENVLVAMQVVKKDLDYVKIQDKSEKRRAIGSSNYACILTSTLNETKKQQKKSLSDY